MKVKELKKILSTVDDASDIIIYDSNEKEWRKWSTHDFRGKRIFQINLF